MKPIGLRGLIAKLGLGASATEAAPRSEPASLAPGRDEIAMAWAGGERLPALVPEALPTATGLSGDQLARHLGEGLDFEQLRAYQPGEPATRIDWRVSARFSEPVVRMYREPAQRQAHLVIDGGAAMRFGTRRRLKLTQALLVAHAFAAGALRQNLAVEIHSIGGSFDHQAAGPVTGQGTVLQRLADLAQAAGLTAGEPDAPSDRLVGKPADWAGLRQRLAQRLPAGSVVIVLSDCLADTGPGRAIDWAPLAVTHHLIFVSVSDRVELDMPDMGLVPFESGTQARWLDTGSPRWREAFAAEQHAVLMEWRESAEALGATFLSLSAHAEPADWLAELPAVLLRSRGAVA